MLTVGNFNVAKLIENQNGITHAKVIGTAFQIPIHAPPFDLFHKALGAHHSPSPHAPSTGATVATTRALAEIANCHANFDWRVTATASRRPFKRGPSKKLR